MTPLALWPLQDVNGFKPVPIPASPSTFTIGRKATCQLVIPDEYAYVSGEHFRLRWLPDADAAAPGCVLEDLSANGTFVGTTKVGKGRSAKLGLGAVISLAKPTRAGGALKFKLQEAPPTKARSSPNLVPPTHCLPGSAQDISAAAASDAADGAGIRAVSDPALRSPPSATRSMGIPAKPSVSAGAAIRAVSDPALRSPPSAAAAASIGIQAMASSSATGAPSSDLLAARAPSFVGAPGPAATSSVLSAALAAEGRRGQGEAAALQARLAEMQIHGEELTAELQQQRELTAELQQERSRCDVVVAQGEAAAKAQPEGCSRRLASECAALKEKLTKQQEDSAHLEKELLPAAEKAVAEERHHTSRLQEELNSARASMDKAEAEAQALRKEWLESEAQAQTNRLQTELEAAEAKNAHLEEECAEIWNDIQRARVSAEASHGRLEARSKLLTTLKGAVKDHAQRLMERVTSLDRALHDLPGGSSARDDSSPTAPWDENSQSRLPATAGGGSRTGGACEGGLQSAPCLRPPALGNPDEPTIAYPPDSSFGLRTIPGHSATAERPTAWSAAGVGLMQPAAKRRRLPGEAAEDEIGECDGSVPGGDRQKSSSSPPPAAFLRDNAPLPASEGLSFLP